MERPNPLRKAAEKSAALAAPLHAVLGAATALGLMSAAQSEAVTEFGAAIPGWVMALGTLAGAVFPALGALQGAFSTAKSGRDDVTPLTDPRSNAGVALVESQNDWRA